MKNQPATIVASLLPVLCGCGSGGSTPAPANAVMRQPGKVTSQQAGKQWTKEEKIAAVQKAPITEDQKKAEIAKINAGG